jgi:hypothetical protein
VQHHDSLARLQDSARQGCYICSAILGQDGGEKVLVGHDSSVPSSISLHGCFWSSRRFIIMHNPGSLGFPASIWGFHLIPTSSDVDSFGFSFGRTSSESVRAVHQHYQKVPPTTGSPAAGDLARYWYQQCRQTHSRCSVEINGIHKAYPPRLLDTNHTRIRLVCNKDLVFDESYAALSHCWGPLPFLALTADRLPCFQTHGIDDTDLPENFRNAITMCRWLGIRYVWIDSLCIIQSGPGSIEDWKKHVTVMGDIYRYCDLCIATAAASSANEACFKQRDPDLIAPVVIDLHSKDPTEAPESYILISEEHNSRGHRDALLASRGWALQERLLSPRILSLGRQQMFWECITTVGKNICETFPTGLPAPCNERGPFGLPTTTRNPGSRYTPTLRRLWLDLIETYCECKLTREDEDKVAAFSGIARNMALLFSDSTYIAGFFSFELPDSLLWRVRRDTEPQSRPRPATGTYRAPSWSWAATNAPIFINSTEPSARFALVEDHNVKLAKSNDPFGQLEYADITLHAPLLRLSWDNEILDNATYKIGGLEIYHQWEFYFDSVDDHDSDPVEVYFLAISGHRDTDNVTVVGLIVRALRESKHAEENNVQRYMRIGEAMILDGDVYSLVESTKKQPILLL